MINTVINIAVEAGGLTRDLYHESCVVSKKTDGSYLTQADLYSHEYIISALLTLTPDTPILSEESLAGDVNDRFSWDEYWLVDPLDGTKEFVSGSGEFTVNIALIRNHSPVLGVVYAPVLDTVYWSECGVGAFKKVGTGQPHKIHVRERPRNVSEWVIIGSRSHQTDEFRSFVDTYPGAEIVSMGSSLKLCLVAE
jgi:3'(2'), 5'-bisphosphate nucleotidase